ncbi:3-hydroxybutyryl-CoA dehydrogenase [Alkalicoccus urumqiensis]|uniref:3-hydroxybutyryl-CoA dehydrogenase n=1 Tax=Alkalicoccus urumqiensis TaxID=1548213 RepID=A0A2P6MHG1_ALKUR|nr:3-hydroxybutyryl-CoA dehydrogenase [Alkalicoccus urumqiensis]PRO65735.1 3-hydroxybutyryl-CoA dehydrogenase [Alkalicoccus urumqiensis]
MEINQVMVIGAGQMGSGIAQTAASSGLEVLLYDVEESRAEAGRESIGKRLKKQVEKERMNDADKERIMRRLAVTTSMEKASEADVIIEAAVENMDVKKTIFAQLDAFAPAHAVLATNTSSLSITEIAAETKRPDRVIGMHFMNPVPVMKLVEVIRGLQTSDATHQTVTALAESMQKTPVEVQDYPGFVSNRILMPMINEAVYAVYEGVSTPEEIDSVMTLGMNHPMGPLTLADFIGLDTCLYIMETLQDGFSDPKYRPCPLLKNYVRAGWLGLKSGRGFYQYEGGSS